VYICACVYEYSHCTLKQYFICVYGTVSILRLISGKFQTVIVVTASVKEDKRGG
jgi:hypothetical protein